MATRQNNYQDQLEAFLLGVSTYLKRRAKWFEMLLFQIMVFVGVFFSITSCAEKSAEAK